MEQGTAGGVKPTLLLGSEGQATHAPASRRRRLASFVPRPPAFRLFELRGGADLALAHSFPMPGNQTYRPRGCDAVCRALDVILSGVLLALLAPLLLLIGVMVRLESPGPALFRQTRFGRDGKPFTILKFRTMTCTENGPVIRQATRNDSRVTPIGRVLRKLSIDELPQLLNVLWGDMSLVGPRPHPVALDLNFARELPYYSARFGVRPGITGLAQVRGLRGEILGPDHLRRRVLSDILYVRRRSVMGYLSILTATVALVFFQREAY